MDTELAEVRDFLAAHAPFGTLPKAVLARLPQRLSFGVGSKGASRETCGPRAGRAPRRAHDVLATAEMFLALTAEMEGGGKLLLR